MGYRDKNGYDPDKNYSGNRRYSRGNYDNRKYSDENYENRRYSQRDDRNFQGNPDNMYDNLDNMFNRIDDAFNSINFGGIFSEISRSVNRAADMAKRGLETAVNSTMNGRSYSNYEYIPSKDPRIVNRKTGYFSMGFLQIIGGIFLTLMGLSVFIGVIPDMDYYDVITNILIFGVDIVATLGGIGMICCGVQRRKLKTRFNRYLREIGKSTVATTLDLSSAVRREPERTIRDLQKLISADIFKQGRLVEDDMLFLLDIKTFEEYKKNRLNYPEFYSSDINEIEDGDNPYSTENIKLDDDIEIEEMINSGNFSAEEIDEKLEAQAKEKEEKLVEETLEKGKEYIDELENIKEKILNDEVRVKTDSLVLTVSNIFSRVSLEQEKVYNIQRFMNYYLPTTVKLLDSYHEFEKSAAMTTEIERAMKDIENTLDVIIEAFSNLLGNLFTEVAMDVHTDISVLKSMLNQEGLIDDGLKLDIGESINDLKEEEKESENHIN